MTVLTEEPRLAEKMTDEQLVANYRSGQTHCFEELIERYRQELFHFLIRFCGNRAAAEDIFQEAFLQIHLSADTFDINKRFKPWLFTIAANKARDYLRKNNRRQAASLSTMIDSSGDDSRSFVDLLEADVPIPDQNALDSEQRELVRNVVQSMPDHLREVLTLAYFNQFAYKEIAEILSIPLGTVKSRLHAAVGTFSQLWKARYDRTGSGGRES
ncbi:sigma-70 family RNA polymerase sigma factor [Planctomycetota bacterium]|nr:sigma-70 family RNA polymerase sigma factor [Planctomycetota bacterium]